MKDQTKNITVIVAFAIFLGVFAVLCINGLIHPIKTSESERRPLAQPPQSVTWESIFSPADEAGSTIGQLESAAVDQFPLREQFLTLKAKVAMRLFALKDNNGLVLEDGYIVKLEQSFHEQLVDGSLERLRYVYDRYLANNGGEHFVCLVPDKNYLLARDYGYPSPNYAGLADRVRDALPGMTYVDIYDLLHLQDYYRTDSHWSQDRIVDVAERLGEALGVADRLSGEYVQNKLEGFRGVYYLQSRLDPAPDTLIYLTNDVLEQCTVYDYETQRTTTVYNPELFESEDGYNVFLGGTRALLRIDNPSARSDDELVVFRDSFGSSLIPLLAEGYRSIYVVDIRYVVPDILGEMIDFENKDVLYLYSGLILNQKAFK